MLSKETIGKIAKVINIPEQDIRDAINSESEEILDIPNLRTYNDETFAELERNLIREGNGHGKIAGQEILIKELKRKLGLEFEGKNPDKFIEHFKNKIIEESSATPNAKIKELENDLKVMREETIPFLKKEKEQLSGQIQTIKLEKTLQKHLPENLPAGLTKDDALILLKNNYEFEIDEGREVVKKNGEILKNPLTRENVSFQNAISDFATERNWRNTTDGRDSGNNDNTITSHTQTRKMSEIEAIAEEKGLSMMGTEVKTMILEAEKSAKENGEIFDYNS